MLLILLLVAGLTQQYSNHLPCIFQKYYKKDQGSSPSFSHALHQVSVVVQKYLGNDKYPIASCSCVFGLTQFFLCHKTESRKDPSHTSINERIKSIDQIHKQRHIVRSDEKMPSRVCKISSACKLVSAQLSCAIDKCIAEH